MTVRGWPGAANDPVTEARSRSLPLNAALALVGGWLDAFMYVGHGHIFANSMTGNVVLFAINVFSRNWSQSLLHLPPIATFLVGVVCARALRFSHLRFFLLGRLLLVLALEIVLLSGLSWFPGNRYQSLFTTIVCFAASLQTATFRQIGSLSYNSTFATGNLRTLADSFFDWMFRGRTPERLEDTFDILIICLTFLFGALLGGLLTPRLDNKSLLLIAGILAGCFVWLAIPVRQPQKIS